MKRIITLIMILLVLLCCCEKEALSYSEYKEIKIECEQLEERMTNAHKMAEAARALGYEEDHIVIALAQQEWNETNEVLKSKSKILNSWEAKKEKYPTATYIWEYFSELGYNDYVIAGILGNIMTETGGQTLKIQHTLSGNGYYGMCQWNKAYSEVWGKSLKEQCDFLRDTIRYEIDTYGYAYKKGFDYSAFLALDNEKDAALAFSKCYERNSSASYKVRKSNATKALKYFSA